MTPIAAGIAVLVMAAAACPAVAASAAPAPAPASAARVMPDRLPQWSPVRPPRDSTLPRLDPAGAARPGMPRPAGPAWSVQRTPNHLTAQGELNADACPSPASCVAVGFGYNRLSAEVTLAEHWNGMAWAIQASPNPAGSLGDALYGVSCSSATACTAVGATADSANVVGTLAERWNGSTWTVQPTPSPAGALGSSLYGVSCASSDACIAVGTYENSSKLDVTLAEAWNGTSWTVLTTLNRPHAGRGSFYGVSCTATAACTAAGFSGQSPVAERWNGTAWTLQFTPEPQGAAAGFGAVSCTSARACTAVGSYPSPATDIDTLAESWNGTRWTIRAAPDPPESQLDGVSCSSSSVCTAVGSYYNFSLGEDVPLAARWTGRSWTQQAIPVPPRTSLTSDPNAVSCPSADACTTVGTYENSAQLYEGFAENWNASGWVITSVPNPAGATWNFFNGISCTSASACTAVGYYQDNFRFATSLGTLAERWNGTSWAVQRTPNPAGANVNVLYDVSCTSPDACMAVGYYMLSEQSPTQALAEQWNGTTWKTDQVPSPAGAGGTALVSVSCRSPSACTAVGAYYKKTSSLTLAEVWNGKAWAVQHTPDPQGNPAAPSADVLTGVSCSSPDACTAIGHYYNSSNTIMLALAERWNGTAWALQQVPDPASAAGTNLVAVSCPTASDCTAVGGYTIGTHCCVLYPALAEHWNGTTWAIHTVPKPAGAHARVLFGVSCTSPGACSAVGYYVSALKADLTLAEAWNGKTWAVQPAPVPAGSGGGVLQGVSCTWPMDCTAAGFYFTAAGNVLTLAETRTARRQRDLIGPVFLNAVTGAAGGACPAVAGLRGQCAWRPR